MRYTMADIGLSAFSLFFMQSPSFLAHQRRLEEGQGRSNCQTLFGLDKIPSDNHVRALLDPASPDHFHPVFAEVVAELERSGGLKDFRQLGDHVLIALDGTEYHVSGKVRCQHCSTRKRGKDKTEHFHAMLSATIVAPDHNRVVPLEPEFIVPQDGHDKQDCESRAVRRWLERHGRRYARLKPIYLGDDLFSRQPVCEAVRAVDGHFLFVCKPASHQTIEEYLTGIDLPTLTRKVKRGRERFDYRYRWLSDVPLRGDAEALTVNWLMIEIVNAAGAVTYRNSFITDLDGRPRHGGRPGRLWPRPLEDRERKLQCPEEQRLQSRTQFRPREKQPLGRVRVPEPARFRLPYRLRSGRRSLAQGDGEDGNPRPVLRKPAIHHHLPDLPHLGRPSGNAGLRQTSAHCPLNTMQSRASSPI